MVSSRPTVSIASAQDAALGSLRASLDVELSEEQVAAVVRRALDLDTSPRSLRNSISSADWVVIKPNIVTSASHRRSSYWYGGQAHPGQVTDLRVVKSLIEYLLEHCSPRRITIAEGGAEWRKNGELGTDPDQTEDGWTVAWPEFGGLSYTAMVAEFNRRHPGVVDIADLNYDAILFLPVPDPHGSGIGALQLVGQQVRPKKQFGRGAYVPGTGEPRSGYYIPETILTCDKLISVPAMKTHLDCGTTLAIKNYVGILPNHPSGAVKKEDIHQGDVQRGMVDLFSYHPADYSVIEGFWATEGNGPQWGENLRHNVVVSSADAVAADAVVSAIMGFNPADLDYLHYAAQKGFGTFNLQEMHFVGTPVEAVKRPFRKGAGRRGVVFAARGNRTWLVREENSSDWRAYTSEERYIDLARCFGGEVTAACAAVHVRSSKAQAGWLWAAGDGPLTVELNGQVVWAREADEPHRLGEGRVPVQLREGQNRLEVHLTRGSQGFGFTALLCDGEGNGLTDIEYRI